MKNSSIFIKLLLLVISTTTVAAKDYVEADNFSFNNDDLIVDIPDDTDFTIHNIPFGVFHLKTEKANQASCASRIGDHVINLGKLEQIGLFMPIFGKMHTIFRSSTLNTFMSYDQKVWKQVREMIQKFLLGRTKFSKIGKKFLIPLEEVKMVLPAHVGDYTDFYSSYNHAFNMGSIFRDPKNAIKENWLYIPIGYHGRASSVVVSGTNIHRPKGQVNPKGSDSPIFKKSEKLDMEVEIGVFLGGKLNSLGQRIKIEDAEQHIFGFTLMNDWSARDIQAWEYVPLGPFTGKSLGTVISPWIITYEALQPFRVLLPKPKKPFLDYLNDLNYSSYDIEIQAYLKPEKKPEETLVSETNYKHMYWSVAQQITQHTVTGCNMKPGDLLGSGTISSGTEKKNLGSFIEMSNNGKEPFLLTNGEKRTFAEDGDEIIFRASAERNGIRIGFGECRSKVLKALD